jgi:hypothetical protein
MTNLFIATNDILLGATIADVSTETGYDKYDVITGNRHDTWRCGSENTGISITFDAGSDVVADHFIVCRYDLTYYGADTPAVRVRYSDDNVTYANWIASTAVAADDLAGPNGEEYIATPTASAAHRYWRVLFSQAAAYQQEVSKIFLGTALDLGRDPVSMKMEVLRDQAMHKARHTLTLDWKGISHAKALEFRDQVAERADWHPICLFTKTYHDVMFDWKVLHCRVLEASTPQKLLSLNEIQLVVEELI